MTWVAIAVGVGSAVVGAVASNQGAKKQADASKSAAKTQLGMFDTLNKQQQPYIQAGYGATSKLNTLLGIGGGMPSGGSPMPVSPASAYRPTQGGGVQQMAADAPQNFGAPAGADNLPLRRILAMRAQHGDTEAQRILGQA
jgi:hypothetical protein